MAATSSSLCYFRMTTHSLIQKIMTLTQQLRILGLGRTPGALGCPSRVTKESITGGSGKQRCHGPRPPPRPGASPSSDRQDLSLPRRESTEALKHLNPSGGRWVHALLQWHCGGVLPVQIWPSQWWSDLKVIEAWEDVTMWYQADCQFDWVLSCFFLVDFFLYHIHISWKWHGRHHKVATTVWSHWGPHPVALHWQTSSPRAQICLSNNLCSIESFSSNPVFQTYSDIKSIEKLYWYP